MGGYLLIHIYLFLITTVLQLEYLMQSFPPAFNKKSKCPWLPFTSKTDESHFFNEAVGNESQLPSLSPL